MKILYLNRYRMLLATDAAIAANTEAMNAIPGFSPLYVQFKGKMTQLDAELDEETKTIIRLSPKKNNLKSEIAALVVEGIAYGEAWGTSTDNSEFIARIHYTTSDLKGSADVNFIGRCRNIVKELTAQKTEIAPFGLTEEKLAAMTEKINLFAALVPQGRIQVGQQKNDKARQETLIDEAMVLVKKLDKLVNILQYSNQQLFSLYKTARVIVDAHRRKSTKENQEEE